MNAEIKASELVKYIGDKKNEEFMYSINGNKKLAFNFYGDYIVYNCGKEVLKTRSAIDAVDLYNSL